MFCVYKHTNKINNKIYIGITSMSPNNRWKNGKGYTSGYIAKAIKKYGWDNFEHEILFDNLTKEEAFKKEIELIKFYKSNDPFYGYNQSSGGEAIALGVKASPETKRKISKNNAKYWKGKKLAETHKQHLRENHANFKGENHPGHKLSQSDVDEIRKIYIPHDKFFGRNALAKKYSVSHTTIQRIVSGKTWKGNC